MTAPFPYTLRQFLLDGDLDNVRALCFHDGSCRVYERNKYDSRVDLGGFGPLPYFRTTREACAFLVANPGKQCQVDTRTRLFED